MSAAVATASEYVEVLTNINQEIKRINKGDSDVVDILSKDQKEHQKELERFHRNVNAIKDMLRHELQSIAAQFTIKSNTVNLEPVDIGYFTGNLKHLPMERRKAVQLAECRQERMGGEVMLLPVFQALARLCLDGVTLEGYDVANGIGLLILDFKRGKVHVRVMPDNYTPSDKAPYPFLIVEHN